MAKETNYTVTQRKELLALGSTMGDIRASESEGTSFEDCLELTQAALQAKGADLQANADRLALANKKALMPENQRHPAVSVFSHPEGDLARPRTKFRCLSFWLNEPLDYDVTTEEEITLMNQLVPGEYRCMRPDGAPFKVSVKGEKDEFTGKMTKLMVWFETRGGLHKALNSRVQMLKDIIAQQKPEALLATA